MGCFGSKAAPVETYSPEEISRSSEQSDSHAKGAPSRSSQDKPKPEGSKRNSTDSDAGVVPGRKSKRASAQEPDAAQTALAEPKGKGDKPVVQRRKSTTESLSELWIIQDEVQPFSQVEVRWKLKGVKANESDWIAMYDGTEIPKDIDIYASSMMATGKNEGRVKFTAPNHPGYHHFRYFLLDDTEAAVSSVFTITKLDNVENIHVRDAMMAENEVLRIEGKHVDDDVLGGGGDEEELAEPEGGDKKKKRKPEGPKDFDDVTGFEVDENSTSDYIEKVKDDAQQERAMEEEKVMSAATNYVKKIPTKKEMRAAAAAKVAAAQDPSGGHPSRSSTEDAAGPKKKAGWGAVRGAVKAAAAFQQGRSNKQDDKFKKKGGGKKADQGGEMGSFVLNRGKK